MRVNVPLTFLLGTAAGYVAGSAAGRRRYEQIRSAAGNFMNDPAVRDTASKVATTAATAASKRRRNGEQGQGRRCHSQGRSAQERSRHRHRGGPGAAPRRGRSYQDLAGPRPRSSVAFAPARHRRAGAM